MDNSNRLKEYEDMLDEFEYMLRQMESLKDQGFHKSYPIQYAKGVKALKQIEEILKNMKRV